MIHVDPESLALVKKILRVFLPKGREVITFGSRATGVRLKKHSDLDLCIMGSLPMTSREVSDLKDAFTNSNVPFRVDVVDWFEAPAFLQKIIEEEGVPFEYNS